MRKEAAVNRAIERPLVGAVTFHAFDRVIHPELIESLAIHNFSRDGYTLRLHLTPAGHALEWRFREIVIVELFAGPDVPLPSARHLFGHRLGAERTETFQANAAVRYQACFQLERMSASLFRSFNDELRQSAERDGVLQMLHSRDRLGFAPMSYLDLQVRPGSLIVHTFHTFPADYAVIKSQTLIEVG